MLVILLLTAIPLCFVVANSLTMRKVRNKDVAPVSQKVSILLPMRNEEKNVMDVIGSVKASEFLSDSEIIVLDDHSTDSTSKLLANIQGIHSFAGIDLPDGWLGKNFACHQLVTHSTGEYLVFVDADVRLTPHAIAAAISDMNSFGWDFISPYPRQIAVTFFERLIQPLLQWSWLSSVPLRYAERAKFPSMVIANGQFLIVKREAYLTSGGHKPIRHEVLDDLELARLLVKSGFKGGVAEGSEVASCRMYNNQEELFAGYTKSLWRAFGSAFGAIATSTYLFVTGVLPVLLAISGYRAAWLGYFAVVLSRLICDIRTQSRSNSALLHPLAIVTLIYLIAKSWYLKSTGQLVWRGRSVA
jgi:glycosyltransferase involved in cell wall biosynthesis